MFEQKSSIDIRLCARLSIQLSSQAQGKTTQLVKFTIVLRIPLNTHFFTGKVIFTASKMHFIWEFFRLLWRNFNAYRKDRK